MELYTFGVDRPSSVAEAISTQKANATKVVWSSWCDAVVAMQDAEHAWTLEYMGVGLTAAQSLLIRTSQDLRNALNVQGRVVNFFGSAMHEGLRGYVITQEAGNNTNCVVLLSTDLEIEAGLPEVEQLLVSCDHEIVDVKIFSAGDVLLGIRLKSTGEGQVVRLDGLQQLRSHINSKSSFPLEQPPLASFLPVQWCVNATTSTILDRDGKVYTFTSDSRYPMCLGRPCDGAPRFELVTYLSETKITKIASGGYMTAAISSEGELFVWGQVCPGSIWDLNVLTGKEKVAMDCSATGMAKVSQVWPADAQEQDVYVKSVETQIDGYAAQVCDVALGHGHVLIVAKLLCPDHNAVQTVFAAGDNTRGQLGLDRRFQFVEEFKELVELKGKRVTALSATGWSSFIATIKE
jgi:hypothetical protein